MFYNISECQILLYTSPVINHSLYLCGMAMNGNLNINQHALHILWWPFWRKWSQYNVNIKVQTVNYGNAFNNSDSDTSTIYCKVRQQKYSENWMAILVFMKTI